MEISFTVSKKKFSDFVIPQETAELSTRETQQSLHEDGNIFKKANEKNISDAAEKLWIEKLREFERKNEITARRIALQWQKEKKTLEEIIDENLKSNQDICEKATALRLQFEFEKEKYETSLKSAAVQANQFDIYVPPSQHQLNAVNNSPPFVMFQLGSKQTVIPSHSGNTTFEYYGVEEHRQDLGCDKENINHKTNNQPWGWAGENIKNPLNGNEEQYDGVHETSFYSHSFQGDTNTMIVEGDEGKCNHYLDDTPLLSKKRKFTCPSVILR